MRYFITILLIFVSASPLFWRDRFNLKKISAPFLEEASSQTKWQEPFSQNYTFLGNGKQSFAFLSEDGKWVIKFFNQSYFQNPLYALGSSKERKKREKRKKYYLNGYKIAEEKLSEETGLVYTHLTNSSNLPTLLFKTGYKKTWIDLNQYPFTIQKKAEPFFSHLTKENVDWGISQFLSLVGNRIALGIADGDQAVRDNFGILDGKLVQIDPGRLFFEKNLTDPRRRDHEWWSTTHRFRKYLTRNFPEKVAFFDQELSQAKKQD